MLIETAERLKKEWTDQYVKIARNAPELKRFQGLTGCVKTVNMNGRALVQFDNGIDISWYDIDPSYLNKVEKPMKAAPAEKHAEAPEKSAPSAASAPSPKPAAATGGKKSPLELAREQAGGAKAGAAPAAKTGTKKSPLELAREQAAAKSGAASESPAKSGTAPAAGASAKKSPLELAREQAAAKGAKKTETAADSETAASTPDAETPAASATPTAAPATPGKKLSPLELARQQGAAKK